MMTSSKADYFDLVPDYIHNTLDPEMRQRFEQEMSSNEDLKVEIQDFLEVQAVCREGAADLDPPSDVMFNKIIDSIDQSEMKKQVLAKKAARRPPSAHRLLEIWEWLKDSITVPWGIALAQAAVIVILLLPGTFQPTYKTLSTKPNVTSTQNGSSFNIVFRETIQESEIRALLLSVNGTIISGPSAEGRYIIAISPDKDSDQILLLLKKSASIVFIEKAL